MYDLVQSVTTKIIFGYFGVPRVRKCLNEARVSADLTETGMIFQACMVDGRMPT